ncbi:hypothetical protein ACTXGO_15415, partial [Psychrobacter sp. T6-1]|uniref:hypothetical protein n=1 Tax=Psychrobacter sp. T6-1 TaxID=3457447 RepID=UPI003FD12D6C
TGANTIDIKANKTGHTLSYINSEAIYQPDNLLTYPANSNTVRIITELRAAICCTPLLGRLK